jgi:hypothetical protein
VFVILGDNDHYDCPNREEGLKYWEATFNDFETTRPEWSLPFDEVKRDPQQRYNFSFVHKGILFIGLNIVASSDHRLTEQVNWTMKLIRDYRVSLQPQVGRVVLFGHADPTETHDNFFLPLRDFIQNELQNQPPLPILYLHGDAHKWNYEPSFYGQESFLRVTLSGEAKEPPTKFTVRATGKMQDTEKAFQYDRMLPACTGWLRGFTRGVLWHRFGIFGQCSEACSGLLEESSWTWYAGPCPS